MKEERFSTVYVKTCMLFFLLFGIVGFVSSKELNIETAVVSDSVPTNRACVNLLENQTISSTVSYLGCSSLTVQNVTVSNNGNLILNAPENVTINGAFEVVSGGSLIVNLKPRLIFEFTYDASGNRIMRQVSVASDL